MISFRCNIQHVTWRLILLRDKASALFQFLLLEILGISSGNNDEFEIRMFNALHLINFFP